MAQADLKTTPNTDSVEAFLKDIQDEPKRQDCITLVDIMRRVTHAEPRMWGSSIVGFGDYHYKYASGREGDTFVVGFSPRKEALTIYVCGYLERYAARLQELGRYKTGKGCLYIKRLQDVDLSAFQELLEDSVRFAAQ